MASPRIHVIICSWNRIDGIISLLSGLSNQTYSDFKVTIVNNNYQFRDLLERRVNSCSVSYPLELIHNKKNLGGRARFIEATRSDSPYCVFIDDDQIVGPSTLDEMNRTACEHTICSWWAWTFNEHYWNRSRVINGNVATYCGTGGMVVDSNLFRDYRFWDNWNPKFYFVEDLYASLYAKSIGWKLYGHKYDIEFNPKLESDTNSLYLNPSVSPRKEELVKFFKGSKNYENT